MAAGSVAAPTIIPLRVAPGRPKNIIDTATRIELASDTAETVIYYTLDKTRPNPAQKIPQKHAKTYRYKEPFSLSEGKVTIKAMACSADHSRESAVVTKNFRVLQSEEPSSGDSEPETEADVEYESPSRPPSISSQLRQRLSCSDTSPTKSQSLAQASVKSLGQASFKSTGRASAMSVGQESVKSVGQSTAVSASGLRPATAEIPEPICLYCKYPRPKDPAHQFCTHCGTQLPPLPDTDPTPPLQVAICSNCRAHLPLGSSYCVVCEHTALDPSPIPVIQAQADLQSLEGKVVCLICGTRNRVDSTHCWTCEKPLQPDVTTPLPPARTPPPLPTPIVMRPISGSTYMMCGRCGRVNVSDARFCDWCGSKPAGSQLMVECVGCQTPNEWHCRHCYACGGIIKAPLRPDVELSSTMKMPATVDLDKDAWVPVVEIADRGPDTDTAATQTDGIFYPSARTIGYQKGSEFIKKMIHISARDRLPKLQGFSPGKGLWRMQLEHVCTHLRAHCQSSNHFQSTLGKLQLGKLLSAELQDEDAEKVEIHLEFALKQHRNTLRRSSSCGNIPSPSNKTTPTSQSAHTTPTKKSETSKSRHRPHKKIPNKNLLQGDTRKLYKELLAIGQGRRDVVCSLIDKGADVNAVAPDSGLPMLSLAASNGHTNCIATLVERGAMVDAQAKATGNTALHEAVLKGSGNLACIEALLGHGANARMRNGDGLTPCDLAMKLKHDEMVASFATYVGAGLLDNLYKYQPSLTL